MKTVRYVVQELRIGVHVVPFWKDVDLFDDKEIAKDMKITHQGMRPDFKVRIIKRTEETV